MNTLKEFHDVANEIVWILFFNMENAIVWESIVWKVLLYYELMIQDNHETKFRIWFCFLWGWHLLRNNASRLFCSFVSRSFCKVLFLCIFVSIICFSQGMWVIITRMWGCWFALRESCSNKILWLLRIFQSKIKNFSSSLIAYIGTDLALP